MKFIAITLIFLKVFFISNILYAEESLTIKQELDRIKEEVRDLNKAVFNKNFSKNEISLNENEDDTERFTSIDIRIYDLEKDIKNLTLQFEEILFNLEDLSIIVNSLETELLSNFKKINQELKNQTISKGNEVSENIEKSAFQEENTLGKLVISDSSNDSDEFVTQNTDQNNEVEKEDNDTKLNNFSPEEQLQFALDQMMKKNYDYSKEILEDFVDKHTENQLSGSAHFWLGKIYLFEEDYRKAAIVFGEGVQKFPKSIKAAEMYYELAKSLKEMNKVPEACKTLLLLEDNYKGNKFTKDPEKIKEKLNCQIDN